MATNSNSLNVRLQLKYDTYSNWITNDPVLLAGEVAIATIASGDTQEVNSVTAPQVLIKIGDGTKKYSELNFISAKAADVPAYAKKTEENFIAWIKEIISTEGAYDTKGSAAQALTDAKAYTDILANGAVKENTEAITGIKNGTTIDSFADVETELQSKISIVNAEDGIYNSGEDLTDVQLSLDKTFVVSNWLPDTYYDEGNIVLYRSGAISDEWKGKFYICLVPHTSESSLTPDNDSVKWQELAVDVDHALTATTADIATYATYDDRADHLTIDSRITAVSEAIDSVEEDVGSVDNLATTDKTLVGAINEVRNSVSAGGTAAAVTMDTNTTTEGALKSYTIKQGENVVGTIDIPKDMVVESGEVVTNPEGQEEGTYIKLVLANVTEPLYINVGTLVDIYKAKAEATQVQIAIDSSTREISATIVAGSIGSTEIADNAITTAKIADANVTKTKLSTEVRASLDKADTALTNAKEYTDQQLEITLGAAQDYTNDHISDLSNEINPKIQILEQSIGIDGSGSALSTSLVSQIGTLDETKANNADLAAIAKTGNVADLIQTENTYITFNCGSSTVNI